MENVPFVISFVIVIVGADHVEVAQYWEADAARKPDYIADMIVAFSNKHGTAIERVIVREINS